MLKRFFLLCLILLCVPLAFAQDSPGDVWIVPDDQTVQAGDYFTTEVHLNSGTQKLAAYGIFITYDYDIINLDIDAIHTNSGVAAGPDGFVSAIDKVIGEVWVSGFDAMGKGPGDDLHVFTIHWEAVGNGVTELRMTVDILQDVITEVIGTPTANNAMVVVEGQAPTPVPTPDITETPTQLPIPTHIPGTQPVTDAAGAVWFVPHNPTVFNYSSFTTELHLNSGNQEFYLQAIDLYWDPDLIELNTSIGNNGVEAGSDGFLNTVYTSTPGYVRTAGFLDAGNKSGIDLHILTFHWNTKEVGITDLILEIRDLTDIMRITIGAPFANHGKVIVEDGGSTPVPPTPVPTHAPTPVPTPTYVPGTGPVTDSAGCVWFDPHNQTVFNYSSVSAELHVNSGTQIFAAQGINIMWDPSIIQLNKSIGYDGVEIGPAGFITSLNSKTPGLLIVAGYDTNGKGPGTDLHNLTFHWHATSLGTTELFMEIRDLADLSLNPIGEPFPNHGLIIVEDGGLTPIPGIIAYTPTPVPTPTPVQTDTPVPTPEPTATTQPTPLQPPTTDIAGAVWFVPYDQTVQAGASFTTEVHLNSGTQKLAAYGIFIDFDYSIIDVESWTGNNGTTPGLDGFVSAVSSVPGHIRVSGYDAMGIGPGDALHIFTIHWKAVGNGTTELKMTIDSLTDVITEGIGTLTSNDGRVIVDGPISTPTPTPVTETPAPSPGTTETPTPEPTESPTPTPEPTNSPPYAYNIGFAIRENTSIVINVLKHAYDTDGDLLNLESFTSPANGTTIIVDGSIQYTPNIDYGGIDSFTYTVTDGFLTDTATVTITVHKLDGPIFALDDIATTDEDTPVLIDVLANDKPGVMTIKSVSYLSRGTAEIVENKVLYTPRANYYGSLGGFSYTISDDTGSTASAKVKVTINPVEDPPVAEDINITAISGEPFSITGLIISGFTDIDTTSSALIIGITTPPVNGTATVSGQYIIYSSNDGYTGDDQIVYSISDSMYTATASIIIRVKCPTCCLPALEPDMSRIGSVWLVPYNQSVLSGTGFETEIHVNSGLQYLAAYGINIKWDPSVIMFTRYTAGAQGFISAACCGNGNMITSGFDAMGIGPGEDLHILTIYWLATGEQGSCTDINLFINELYDEFLMPIGSPRKGFNGSLKILKDSPGPTPLPIPTPVKNVAGAMWLEPHDQITTPGSGFSIELHLNSGTQFYAAYGVDITYDPTIIEYDVVKRYQAGAQGFISAVSASTPRILRTSGFDAMGKGPGADLHVWTTFWNAIGVGETEVGMIINDLADEWLMPIGVLTPNNGRVTVSSILPTSGPTPASSPSPTPLSNGRPVAQDDIIEASANKELLIDVLINDTDPDGNKLYIIWLGRPSNGTAVLLKNKVKYTPNQNYTGPDYFTYRVSDGDLTATAQVAITVIPSNDPPAAYDDTVSTNEDTAVTIDVLANDSDPDDDALVIESVTQPSNGTATIASGNIVYTPDTGFYGIDSFIYTVSDSYGATDSATVTVTVNEIIDSPVAIDDIAYTQIDSSTMIDVLKNDKCPGGELLEIESVGSPESGIAIIMTGMIEYIAYNGFSGEDNFTYTIKDSQGRTSTAIVNITVGGDNNVPDANDDIAFTDNNTSVIINVLANDTDPYEDELVIESLGTPESGTAIILGENIEYTPSPGFTGIDIFVYTITNSAGKTDAATVMAVIYDEETFTPEPTLMPTPLPTLTPTIEPEDNNPYERIEAENYDDMKGVRTQRCKEGTLNVGWINRGDWINFEGLEFGSAGAESFTARVASGWAGGEIQVRLDAVDGDLIGTCRVNHTDGWQSWETRECDIYGVVGTHNVYLVFEGGWGYLFNINWFQFKKVQAEPTPEPTPGNTKVFEPIHDAYLEYRIDNDMPNEATCYNNRYLKVEPGRRVTYLMFDVEGTEIKETVLKLKCTADPGKGTINIYSGTHNNWTEDNLTETNKPDKAAQISSMTRMFNTGRSYTWDITQGVTGGKVTFILEMTSGSNDAWFHSAEGVVVPILEVSY